MAKRYTVMVIPEVTGKFRRFSISSKVVRSFLLLTVILAVGSVYFTHRHIELSKEVVELEQLRAETRDQRLQIESFSRKVEDFEKRMGKLALFDKKLRIITSLDGSEQAPANYAIGGVQERRENSSKVSTEGGAIADLDKDLNQLMSQANLQELSFQELDRFFKEQASLLSSTPSIWPVRGWVTSGFGYRISPFSGRKEMHEGLDIATRTGSLVVAPAEGMVVRAGSDPTYGEVLEIDHGYGLVSRYGHNSEVLVTVGDQVKRGQPITKVGNTGRSTGPHLHYEIILNGIPVNPFQYIIEEG